MKWQYKPRWLADNLRQAVEFSPVVVLSGARQSGKSTLLRYEAPFREWRYVTLDDFDTYDLAKNNPLELVSLHEKLIIDEVQKCPELLPAIKMAVDRDRRLRLILSGSANLLLMKQVTESLAGRCLYFDLLPFALGEESSQPVPEWLKTGAVEPAMSMSESSPMGNEQLFRGALPPVTFLEKEAHVSAWWTAYTKTYLERDLRDFSRISDIPDFRRVMVLLASRSAQILNQATIARETRVSQPTVNRYINLLEMSGLYFKLQPYSRNVKKRVVKSPKGYFLDTGLMCSLTGLKRSAQIEPDFRGQLFETRVFHNLLAVADTLGGHVYYLRKQGGLEREIDFILELEDKILAIEVKASSQVSFKDAENIEKLQTMLSERPMGFVIYNGDKIKKLRQNILAVPDRLLSTGG